MSAMFGSGRSFPKKGNDTASLDDLQAIVRSGYTNCSRRTYLIRIEDIDKPIDRDKRLQVFKEHGLIPLLTNESFQLATELHRVSGRINQLIEAAKKPELACIGIDVGFTFSGLERLSIRKELREVFCRKSPAFYGNAFSRAQKHLGDTGLSDPQHWRIPYKDQKTEGGFHIALIAHFPYVVNHYSDAQEPLENEIFIQKFETELVRNLLGLKSLVALDKSLNGDWIEVSAPLGKDGREHFGYRDGITAPVYAENAPQQDDEGYRTVHKLGEILLGHKRNDGDNLYGNLGLTHKRNPNIGLQKTPAEETQKLFFKNSSFGVLRKMEQRVEKFNEWVAVQAQNNFPQDKARGLIGPKDDDFYYAKKWIRSKIMGRTPNGVLLTPEISIEDVEKELIKDTTETGFRQKDENRKAVDEDDSQGLGCPFSSHIRRMNPRDDPITPFIHRPVIRRGMPYADGTSKGLSGLFICADIEEQFEHLVGKWANHGVLGIPDESTCKDPIIGNHEPQNNLLYLYSHPVADQDKYKVAFDEPFVITRGCAYIWFPAISVLAKLGTYTDPLT